jgi:predicted O-methyltransferase YrrM
MIYGLRRLGKRRRDARELIGAPCSRLAYPLWRIYDRWRWGRLGYYISRSRRIQGWVRGPEAVALASYSHALPDGAAIVEIGSFLGGSAVLLAGARKLRGSGRVHCVDPFDASGDTFSARVYAEIESARRSPLRQRFEGNIRRAGLSDWVLVHQGRGDEVAGSWSESIDMLFLDGDQSREGVRSAYESWSPFLKRGGIIALHNSRPGSYHEGHDGHMRLAADTIQPPEYEQIACIGSTTFARKMIG